MVEIKIGDKIRINNKIAVVIEVDKADYCCNICELQECDKLCNHINCHGDNRKDNKFIVLKGE